MGQDLTQTQSQRRSEWLESLETCCLPLVGKLPSVSSIITPSLPQHISLVCLLGKLSYGKMPFFLYSAVTPMLVISNGCVGVVCDCERSRWSQAKNSDIQHAFITTTGWGLERNISGGRIILWQDCSRVSQEIPFFLFLAQPVLMVWSQVSEKLCPSSGLACEAG